MNLDNIPSKSEVMGWNSDSLANYLKKMKLSGCDTVVKRCGMNGAKFLTMSSNDLQKFPKVHVPLITKLSNDINQGVKKKGLFQRLQPSRPPNPGNSITNFAQKDESWDSEEFDDDSDQDYEEPDADTGTFQDNYVCAEDLQQEEMDDVGECEYELPPSETPTEIPSHFRSAKPLGQGEYIDSVRNSQPKEQPIRPPQRPDTKSSLPSHPAKGKLPGKGPKPDFLPQRPATPTNKPKLPGSAPQIDRRTKPRSSGLIKSSPEASEKRNYPMNTPNDLHSAPQQSKMSATRLISRPIESSFPPPPPPDEDEMLPDEMEQDMDPDWYVGAMTRAEAEVSLRQINRDGAYLIRDSSKNATDQPYTLMVLNKLKVYNIQIRFHGNSDGYSLGTGTETFPSVRDMVTHHTKTHLMLIDAMERGTGAQHQCCLMHPARR
ncbi:lymphocyte cytosolic protein 2 [Astyanax mexicanus]|uniref:Lymphocyte cytosolic protein 2-like n=2 Tax=Astyanax mexicanus TaxID=7994 RepID=A0A8T2LSX8_ASTMX|nr:lymphocyte cytosolic protein 2 [Astyanax mexicanus]KAG9272725.1 lymphocyte cytosolic protein 2-like [Astyanax mexicanus]